MTKRHKIILGLLAGCGLLVLAVLRVNGGTSDTRASLKLNAVHPAEDRRDFEHEVLASGLEHPWGMAFLPDRRILLTERPGRMRLIGPTGLLSEPVAGLPEIVATGQGGLLDVALHPQYELNGWLYFTYAGGSRFSTGTHLARARLSGLRLTELEILFTQNTLSMGGRHFGSRIVFDGKGFLYFSVGDRGDQERAQDTGDHAGSIIRLREDGSVPAENPFRDQPGSMPEIFSYGHRNPQGMARHPTSGEIWLHEHGPQGGDELNRIIGGRNYGWPVITYGVNYGTGTKIGEGTHKAGMEQPVHYWVPSIAPSGMTFYAGSRFPDWQGNVLLGALKFQQLVRLELDGNRVISETRYLTGRFGRIRDVEVGPDGAIYLLTDADEGALIRLTGFANAR